MTKDIKEAKVVEDSKAKPKPKEAEKTKVEAKDELPGKIYKKNSTEDLPNKGDISESDCKNDLQSFLHQNHK